MRLLAGFTLIALCGCDPFPSRFQREMSAESSKSGLAIGYIGGSAMNVMPLGEAWLSNDRYENYSGPCRSCPGWFSSDGKLIVWQQADFWEHPGEPALLVRTIAGDTVATWFGKVIDVNTAALSPDKSKIAFEAADGDSIRMPNMGLQYVVLGTPKRVILEPETRRNELDGSASIGWSPDSRSIVFSRHDKVIIINIETGERRDIANGSAPAWSPNGHWISYTSPEARAMLIDPSSLRQVVLWNGHKTDGPIAWSPNSCCISFSAEGKDIDTIPYVGGRIIVYRISDGAWFPLSGFSYGIGSSAHFGWFYGYKEFLARNHSNAPAK